MYAIHSNNPEFINCLEENHLLPNDETYFETIEEAIKCHHNEIADYIKENLLIKYNNDFVNQLKFIEYVYSCAFENYNYTFYPNNFEQNFFICAKILIRMLVKFC